MSDVRAGRDGRRRPLRPQRRGRLSQRPAGRRGGHRQRGPARPVPGGRPAPQPLGRPAAALHRPALRVAQADAGPDPAVLQGRHVRRQAGRRGVGRAPAPGRDDRARQAVRRSPRLRAGARRRDVRRRLRGSRGQAVPDGHPAPHGPGRPVLVRGRRRGEPRDGSHAVGDRALYGGRPPVAGGQGREALRRRGQAGRRRRQPVHRRHQPVHLRGDAESRQAAGRVRRVRQDAAALEGHRRDRHGVPDRRDLRQGRGQRGQLGPEPPGVPAAVRRGEGPPGVVGLPREERSRGADHGLQALPVPDRVRRSRPEGWRSPTPVR